MTDQFQCQYCGKLAPLSSARMAWQEDNWKRASDEDPIFSMTITCSPSCAERVTSLSRISR